MRANCRVYSRKACSPTRIEVMPDSSRREDILGVLAYQEEPPSEEERQMIAESAVLFRQAALRDAMSGVAGLVKDAVAAISTPERHSGVKRQEN